MQKGLSIKEIKQPTNLDISVIFTPEKDVTNYQYRVSKDGQYADYYYIDGNSKTTINLTETGKWSIEVITYNEKGITKKYESGIYNLDKDSPILDVGQEALEMHVGDKLSVLDGVKATDNLDGDILSKVVTNVDQLDLTTPGIKKLVYTVSDEAGNTTSKTVAINVLKSNEFSLMMVQTIIIFVLLIFLFLLVIYRRSVGLEKRIAKYGIEPLKDNTPSLFDNLYKYYYKVVSKLSKILSKSVFITKYSKRYEKYINTVNKSYKSGLDFVSTKFIVSFIFILIAVFSKTIQYELLSIYEIIFPFFLGFFILDIIYASKYRIYLKKIENDLLQAIIIMNNAFKSGRSITQAISLVTTELDGPIKEEFKKMHMELSFGLEIDVVFSRFASRIKLKEVTYLTASLSILNKTGGNIIKVFSSIERSLFNKKKLQIELNSLTGSSRIIVYILFLVPILFIIFILLINPTYFVPLYTTKLGLIISWLIICLYIVYIISVRKIMKVRM